MNRVLLSAMVFALAACQEDEAALPDPVNLTAEATGFYCQMNLLEHPGPKAQVHLAGMSQPIFFSQVRDAIAFQRMPEQSHAIVAIYVNDMGHAPSWDEPGADNWVRAEDVFYVEGSDKIGGMGASELVPFSEKSAAAAFATENGGTVLNLFAIPDAAVLDTHTTEHSEESSESESYADRLRSLASNPES